MHSAGVGDKCAAFCYGDGLDVIQIPEGFTAKIYGEGSVRMLRSIFSKEIWLIIRT